MTASEEIDFLTEVVQRYEGDGYQVLREPPSSKLPKQLRGFHPDLLALKGNERVVVEIKKASGPLDLDAIARMKRSVGEIPGWRLDVVWLGDTAPSVSRQPLSDSEIRSRLEDTPTGRSRQAHELELMALWAYFEAAVRNRLKAAGEEERSPIPPSSLVRKAISFGLLPQDELVFLDELARARNQIVHGFQVRKKLPTALKRLRKLILRVLSASQH